MSRSQVRRRSFRKKSLELLEHRYALAALVAVEDGDLVISGAAEGELAIIANAEGVFSITEGDRALGDFHGVTDDIRIKLTTAAASVDRIVLDLNSRTFDSITVDLGEGENHLILRNGEAGVVFYRGGAGPDVITLAADASVAALTAHLGDGDNEVTIAGQVARSVAIHGGNDADTVTIAESASIGRDVLLSLGDGPNEITVAGEVGGHVIVRGGRDVDDVNVEASASLAQHTALLLGNGANTVNFGGTSGKLLTGDIDDDLVNILAGAQIEGPVVIQASGGDNSLAVGSSAESAAAAAMITGSLLYTGAHGSAAVSIGAEATMAENMPVKVGAGTKTLAQAGAIVGNLRQHTKQESDALVIDPIGFISVETTTLVGDNKPHAARRPLPRSRDSEGGQGSARS